MRIVIQSREFLSFLVIRNISRLESFKLQSDTPKRRIRPGSSRYTQVRQEVQL